MATDRGLALAKLRTPIIAGAFVAYGVGLWIASRRWELPRIDGRAVGLLILAWSLEVSAKVAFAGLFRVGLRRVGHPVSWRAALAAAWTGSAVARLLPAGGALTPSTMAFTVRGEEPEAAGAAVRVTVVTYGGLLIMTGTGLVWMATEGPHPLIFAGAIVLGSALAVAGAFVLAGTAVLDRLVGWLPDRLRDYLAPTAGGGPVSWVEGALVAVRVVSEAAVLWAAVGAFGVELTPSETVVAFGLSTIVGGLLATPGGLGVVEGGLVGLLTAYGFAARTIVAPVLVYRIIDYWIPAGIGVAVFAGRSRAVRGERPGRSGCG